MPLNPACSNSSRGLGHWLNFKRSSQTSQGFRPLPKPHAVRFACNAIRFLHYCHPSDLTGAGIKRDIQSQMMYWG
jgi:hypothetical protein